SVARSKLRPQSKVSANPIRNFPFAAAREPSDRIVRSLVETSRVQEYVSFHELGTFLAEAEAVVILADQEQLRFARIDVRVDSIEHRPIARKRGRGPRLVLRRIQLDRVVCCVPRQPA